MPLSLLLIFHVYVWTPRVSKRLKLSGATSRRLQANKGENLTKCARAIDAYVKNAEK